MPSKDHPPISLPIQLKALNALGPIAAAFGLDKVSDNPHHYMEKAKKKVGLSDFGSYDLTEPLRRTLYTMKNESELNMFGRIGAHQMIMRNLTNNLLIQQSFKDYPDIHNVNVDDPIIIICTPRTGSTLLHNLMNMHPDVRSPKMWELHRPCPPPHPKDEFTDPRIKESDNEFGLYYRLVPEMKAIHYFAPEAIEECTHLFGNIFTCRLSFSTLANASSYSDWIWNQNMAPAYEAYKEHLKILKYHYQDKFLVLKSPVHILQLDALETVFPKAKIVHLHRDPAIAAGSFCSLTEAVQISMRKTIDPLKIGDMWKQFWTPAMLDSIEWRERTNLQVLDVNFRDLVKKPVETVTDIYQQFNKPLTDKIDSNIKRYLSDHPKDEYGIHEYSLSRYGLNQKNLHKQYQPYIERFNVSIESKK